MIQREIDHAAALYTEYHIHDNVTTIQQLRDAWKAGYRKAFDEYQEDAYKWRRYQEKEYRLPNIN